MIKDIRILPRPERRYYKRLAVDLSVNLNVEGRQISTSAANISCGGLFLPIKDGVLKERTDIQITLSLPDSQKPVRVIGEVKRYQDRSLFKNRKGGVAIEFRGLYDDNILAIDRYIKQNLH